MNGLSVSEQKADQRLHTEIELKPDDSKYKRKFFEF